MPHRYPAEVRFQVIEGYLEVLAGEGQQPDAEG
jgi:hypothetical protein